MPAEFNVDPLGLGKLSGIARLWAPEEKTWKPGAGMDPRALFRSADRAHDCRDSARRLRTGPKAALEYKFAMKQGQTLLYKWEALNADGSPVTDAVEFDFHGHTLAADGEEMTVANYRKDRGHLRHRLAHRALRRHPWLVFQEPRADPITIRLVAEGFYALVPPGEPGNEFRISAKETHRPSTISRLSNSPHRSLDLPVRHNFALTSFHPMTPGPGRRSSSWETRMIRRAVLAISALRSCPPAHRMRRRRPQSARPAS